jgi:hypothetical protein
MKEGVIHEARIQGKKIRTVDESGYKPEDFKRKDKPADWPEKWPYPHNPTYAALSVDPPPPGFWPKCEHCKLQVVSAKTARVMSEQGRYICNFVKDVANTLRPLIEVREYSAAPGDPSPLNRGVRALSNIKERAIIKEYTRISFTLLL